MKTKIKKFGIEIEGEFSGELREKLYDLDIGKFVSDGSIQRCIIEPGQRRPKGHNAILHCAEFVTEPLLYESEKDTNDLEEMFLLLDEYYKKGHFHFNKTMGMHIHVSFEPKLPTELWSWEFVKYFESQLRKTYKGVYESRVVGNYCKQIKDEKEVATGGERYREINFRRAFEKHGTIEFRIFPTNKPKRMEQYLKFTQERINAFIYRENIMLSKTFEFELEGKRRITKTQTVEIDSKKIEKEEKRSVEVCETQEQERREIV